MEIRNNKKLIITGRTICFVAALILAICSIYWIAQALFYDNTNLPMLLSTTFLALLLTLPLRPQSRN